MSVPDQMNRRAFLSVAVCGVVAAMPALASSFVDEVVRQLRALGFTEIRVKTTLLGRTQITAIRADGAREIILNPRTGEILRDLWVGLNGRSGPSSLIDFDSNNSGTGGGTDDAGDDTGDDDTGDGDTGGGDTGGGSDSEDDPSDSEDDSDSEDENEGD